MRRDKAAVLRMSSGRRDTKGQKTFPGKVERHSKTSSANAVVRKSKSVKLRETTTAASSNHDVCQVLAKHEKSFQDGKLFKEVLLSASKDLFGHCKDRTEIMEVINKLQRTVTQRCEGSSEDLEKQLKEDIKTCASFSLQLEKSTDINNNATHTPGELLPEIKDFLKQSNQAGYERLDDTQWLMDLAFLVDQTEMLNELNSQLQGKDRRVMDMISTLQSFKVKLNMSCSMLQRRDLHYFEPVVSYMRYPFGRVMEVEHIQVIADKMGALFGVDVTAAEYPSIRRCAVYLTAMFGSRYFCESVFSHVKAFKSRYRSSAVANDHLVASFRIATRGYQPDFNGLPVSSHPGSSQFSSFFFQPRQIKGVQSYSRA